MEITFSKVSTVTNPNQNAKGLFVSSDGTKFYSAGSYGLDSVYEYSMSTPFDITTASLTRTKAITTENNIRCISFSSDGSKFYLTGSENVDQIEQYSVSTPWDIQ